MVEKETLKVRQRDAQKRFRKNHPEVDKQYRLEHKVECRFWDRKWRIANVEKTLLMYAKYRARRQGVPFSIGLSDIPPMGTHCPLLGHPFAQLASGSPFAPSLDRINPRLGYVKGNVWIVGSRANVIKGDGTAEEHEQIARALRAVEASR